MLSTLSPESWQQITAQASALEEQLLVNPDAGPTLDGYINRGSTSTVFHADGHPELVLRMPYADSHDDQPPREVAASHVNDYVVALTPAIGHTGLEQLVTYNHERPAMVVSEYAGPLTLDDMCKNGQLAKVSTSQFRRYLIGLCNLQNLGLHSDISRGNVVFNKKLDPTIIDFIRWPANPQSLREKVLEFASTDGMFNHMYQYPDRKLPPEAFTFNTACRQLFGPGVSRLLATQWDTMGFKIPNNLIKESWRDDFTTLSAKITRARYNLPKIT